MTGMDGAPAAGRRGTARRAMALALGALLASALIGVTALAQSGGDDYTVKKGDTLWDIAAEKLGEAVRWPEIWKQNKQIADPHWIYPGDRIRIAGESPPAVAAVPSAPAAHVTPAPPKLLYTRIHSSGFVATGDFDRAGEIIASFRDHELLFEGNEVFINRGEKDGVRVGDWFLVFRPGEPVAHPHTDGAVGVRVVEEGHIRITQVGKSKSRARIVRGFSAMTRGDRVTPFNPLPVEFTVQPAPDNVSGTVVALQDGRLEAGRDDLVYVDIGREDGIKVGARFAVYRDKVPFEVRSAKDLDLPPDVIGEAVIVRVSNKTSTALLTRATDSVLRGTRVAALRELAYPASEAAPISSDPAYAPKATRAN